MKNILSLIFITLFIILTTLSASAKAQAAAEDKKDWVLDLKTSTLIPNYAGKVKVIRGKVMAGENELAKGDKIYPKSLIKTSDKSFVVFELIDETVLSLGPQTEFLLENWNYKTKTDREAVLSLLIGKMRAEIKVKTKEADQLKIKSPLVAMGIRGTEVLLNNSMVNGKMVTQVALMEGSVIVLNKGNNKKMNLAPNDYVEVMEGSTGSEIEKKLTSEESLKYNAIVAPNEKLLMDFPIASIDAALLNDKSEFQAGIARPSSSAVDSYQPSHSGDQHESKSWKENLKKLNELRKKSN